MTEVVRASVWSSMCQQTQRHALLMAARRSAEAQDLIASVTRKFCDLPAPATEEEMWARHRQEAACSALIAAIAHADSMIRSHPVVAQRVFKETRHTCQRELPTTDAAQESLHTELVALSAKIASTCHEDTMNMMRRIRQHRGVYE